MTKPLNRKALYDLVWSKPMTAAAKEYGLSDRGLAKLCERNSIPVPPRGYWAKKAAGQKVKKAPLIVLEDKEPETAILLRKASPSPARAEDTPVLPEAIQEAIDRERQPGNLIRVPATMHKPHAIVDGWIQDEKREAEFDRKYGKTTWRPTVTSLDRRGRRITSALFKALEARGFKVAEEGRGHYHKELWIRYDRDKVSYQIRERIRQYRRELTEEEKANRYSSNQKWTQEKEPTGKLEILLEGESRYSNVKIQEEDDKPFEDTLNEVVIKIIETIWALKSRRLEREEDERRRRDEEHARYERRLAAEKEEKRKLNLEYKAMSWERSRSVREYIAAVEQAKEQGRLEVDDTEFESWRAWATKHADDLDFIANGNPLIGLTEDPEHLFDADDRRPGHGSSYSSSGSWYPGKRWYQS